MNDETLGAGQGALPPRDGARQTTRVTQVGSGQYVLTTPSAFTQIGSTNLATQQCGITRILSISPSRSGQISPLRPSLSNQSIVDALKKSRPNSNVRLQLFPTGENLGLSAPRSSLKRSLPSTPEKKDNYIAKMQRVMNHRNVRSKILKEKYNDNLLESFHLEMGGNILDLYQFAKRPKTQQFINYMKENSIDPKDNVPETIISTTSTINPVISHASTTSTSISSNSTTSFESSNHLESTSDTLVNKNTSSNKIKTPTPCVNGSNQEQIVEKAKQEAYVVQRVNDLQKEGLWSEKRLPKIQEIPRIKTHWDFLLEEMVWLAADFAQERKWKKAAAKKCARMVQKYFQDKALAAQRAEKAHEQHIKRLAAFCAKEIKTFWVNVEKLVEYKQNTRLEEKRKKALDQQLSFIVDQTEKYSRLLAEGMNKFENTPAESPNSMEIGDKNLSDDEFRPNSEVSSDDEETIAQEEAVGSLEQSEEVAALKRESQMELEDFLNELPKDYLENRDKIKLSDNDDSDDDSIEKGSTKEDEEFRADSTSDDDEDTIQEQEKVEGSQDHEEEINDLNAEAEMDIEELRRKYSSLPPVEDEDSRISAESMENSELDDLSESQEESELSEVEGEEEEEVVDKTDVGLKSLLDDSKEGDDTKTDNNTLINDAAAIAESIQPKGNTLSSTKVVTPIPHLLKYTLREYQHIGLDWLVTMFERKLNGILADEMGLGKTIQTIALLAHLACEKENWGPHLIVVPTSVMLNWEMECKKWCPAFKILTYYGSQKERKLKRIGWTKTNAFHICITSYKLVIQDHQSFRRKKWKYLILDEAQNIKNFKSQRWQLLLNFQTQQRLLLTGTPLQNNLMELWSLMHFLMPNVFQSHREFKEWFSNPVTGMIEGNSEYNENIIKRLHKVLRPFLLRRLKCEVEKQMPRKYEHVVMCRLSKRQRFLYDDYMSRAKTREVLAGGNLLHVINVLMQLRKVCNHPNLFEVRPTVSPFRCEGVVAHIPSLIYSLLEYDLWNHVNLESLNLNFMKLELSSSSYQCYRLRQSCAPRKLIEELDSEPSELSPFCPPSRLSLKVHREKPVVKADLDDCPKLLPNQQQKFKIVPAQSKGIQLTNSTNQTTSVNLSSVLKPSVPGYAQLVQTSTGKHILLTPTCNINANSIGLSNTTTVMTSSGQRLTVFSKQPVQTANAPAIAKAVVKVQLTSISPTSPMNSVSNEKDASKTIGAKYLDKLYTNSSTKSKSLDVRWQNSFSQELNNCDSEEESKSLKMDNIDSLVRINTIRCNALPVYGKDFIGKMQVMTLDTKIPFVNGKKHCLDVQYKKSVGTCLSDMIYTPEKIVQNLSDIFNRYLVYVPAAQAPEPVMQVWKPDPSFYWGQMVKKEMFVQELAEPTKILHTVATSMTTQFPHPRLIQYDCGKLQTLDVLLRKLKYGGHRVLIFTQMTKMLDVLEAFLNFHGHIYLRLDGSTKIDQRQILMERFNGDTRIFVFILSTRSGGVGVNLTGADTVIFYDSDWNPTMDAQAQDRCHRIGQTRDVHIYRLVSEMTIEENILKKANQKRLLGDLAIEGGNFTTAYFKSSTIQDLFKVDSKESKEREDVEKMDVMIEDVTESNSNTPNNDEKVAIGTLESLLATSEDDQDVKAACSAKAEAVADLAEFDENIPIEEQEKEKEPEISKAEQEVEHLIKQLTPIEKYAMRFIEETEAAWSAEQLAAAEREIEEKKREWEENRIAAMHEENERRKRELEEESEILTFSREDATNQMWISDNTKEEMPMWCPPTPPQQDTDMYLDVSSTFLYHRDLMGESQLPPVYIKKELKRTRNEAGLVETRRALKIQRKDDCAFPPRSIFERPSPALMKIRRDLKMQKYRGIIRTTPLSVKYVSSKPVVDPPCLHNWIIHEDMALLKVIQNYQGLNMTYTCAGHTPNWEFVADYVNTVSITYRSPKQCRIRYETVLVPREEGKQVIDNSPRKKKQKTAALPKYSPPIKSNRSLRTSQLYNQDNNSTFSQLIIQRHDSIKGINVKKPVPPKTIINSPLLKNPKHASVLSEAGIDLDNPVMPVEVAARRAERVAREKKTITPEQIAAAQKLHLLRVQASAAITSSPSTTSGQTTQALSTTSTSLPIVATPSTPPGQIRMQRIVASPLQTSTVVSMSGVSPAQLQAATQRIIVSGSPVQAKATVVGSGATVAGKTINSAQLHLLRTTAANIKQQQLRLQSGVSPQGIKSTTVTIAGQNAVQVHFTQAQATRTQYIKQAGVTVAGKQGIARAVTESEMALLLKRQQQLQQQKALAAAVVSQSQSIQSVAPQVLAQAIQASASGQVATLVKAVPTSGVNQTVIGTQMKTLQPGTKQATAQHIRTLQLQQQLLAQKKLVNQKIAGIAQVTGKAGVAAQLIVGSKPIPTAMTMQQFQQVIRSPLNVPQGPVVLAKAPRVIPVNAASGSKPTIQVVAATSQGITTTIRSQTSSTLAGALAGIKVQGGSQAQNAILSQVTAALQGQNVRQSSPVRLQSANGNPIVAVSVQSTLPGSSVQNMNEKDHVSRLLKK